MYRLISLLIVSLWLSACASNTVRVSGRLLNPPTAELEPSATGHNRTLVKKGWEAMSEAGPCGEARADAFYYVAGGQVGLSCVTMLDENGECRVKATVSDAIGQCSGEADLGPSASTVAGANPCARSLTCRLQRGGN